MEMKQTNHVGYAQNLIMKKVKALKNGVKVYFVFDYSLDGLEQIIVVNKTEIKVFGYFNNNFLTVLKNNKANLQYLEELLRTNQSSAYKENTYNFFTSGWRYKSHGDEKLKNILIKTKKELLIEDKNDKDSVTTDLLSDILGYHHNHDFEEYVNRNTVKQLKD